MRLDHLLSKGRSKGWIAVWLLRAEGRDARLEGLVSLLTGDFQVKQTYERPGVHKGNAKHLRMERAGCPRQKKTTKDNSGGDAPRGNTRSHPEHDG